jgi:hypothetical protein
MAKYRKKPVVIEAVQWFKTGDHPAVIEWSFVNTQSCVQCGKQINSHGSCETLEGNHIVCPGDWIITGIKGEYYPCKPDIFEATYELVEND